MPEPPAVEVPIKLGGKPQVIDDFNEAANKQFLASLEQCPYCKRKFAPEPYKHHQRSCTASNPAKPAGTALVSTSLSNNKRLQPYTVISGSKKSSISSGNTYFDPLALQHRKCLFRCTRAIQKILSHLCFTHATKHHKQRPRIRN
ncbi:hypothetical protein MPTK1_5g22610 [Marchantia polymorpha subsp. ruderalis]